MKNRGNTIFDNAFSGYQIDSFSSISTNQFINLSKNNYSIDISLDYLFDNARDIYKKSQNEGWKEYSIAFSNVLSSGAFIGVFSNG